MWLYQKLWSIHSSGLEVDHDVFLEIYHFSVLLLNDCLVQLFFLHGRDIGVARHTHVGQVLQRVNLDSELISVLIGSVNLGPWDAEIDLSCILILDKISHRNAQAVGTRFDV